MLRREIRLTGCDPTPGSEADKRRPAAIVNNGRANVTATRLGRGVVTVVPVTSTTSRVFPFQTLLPATDTGQRVDSQAQAEQVRAVSIQRLSAVVARLPPLLMAELDGALHLQL